MPSGLKQDLSIGDKLRSLRKAQGLTQEAVIAKLGEYQLYISREVLSQIENGRHSIPVKVLIALQTIYRVDFNEIFSELSIQDVIALIKEEPK